MCSLRRYSRYVKDVFGLKMVVGNAADARRLQKTLENLIWTEEELLRLGGAEAPHDPRLTFVEVKDYLGEAGSKQSGWEAVKSVVRWEGGLFELQLQPLADYFMERERLTRESHAAFKQNRERLRNELGAAATMVGRNEGQNAGRGTAEVVEVAAEVVEVAAEVVETGELSTN